MGSAFRLPIWIGPDYAAVLNWCSQHRIQTVCADTEAKTFHTDFDWTGANALIVGPESTGLSAEEIGLATAAIRIPMHGEVESLNVAAAATIVLYEAARQRSIRT
jgi:TrmH family RNA methyltransferase